MLEAIDLTPLPENDEPFQVLIDEPYLLLLRDEGVYVCQVHLPWDLGDLGFELGRLGFVVDDAYSETSVLDLKLRKLGDVPLVDDCPHEEKIVATAAAVTKEEIYA